MNTIKYLIMLPVIIFFTFAILQFNQETGIPSEESRVYYVDHAGGSDLNKGTSPAQAWKSIRKLNSLEFLPGDKILFKRGGTWQEQLNLRASGDKNRRILISDYGNGELPVIDGGSERNQCILLHRSSYVSISNIRMQNAVRQGAVRIKQSNNILIENCSFYVTGHGAVFIEESRDCVIGHNDITTPPGSHDNQTDGIYSQRNKNIVIDNNTIIILNAHPDQHCDGIQSYQDENITISNNYIEQRNGKRSNAQGIYATNMTGRHIYYNNVVYCPNTRASVVGFRNLTHGNGYLKAYHNTLVGGGSNILFVSEDAGIDARNNIFYTTGASTPLHLETSQILLWNNLYFSNGLNKVAYLGRVLKTKELSYLQQKGYDFNGLFADPDFQEEFRLSKDSPAIDNASELGPPYNIDKSGNQRDAGLAPDIGAYEFLN